MTKRRDGELRTTAAEDARLERATDWFRARGVGRPGIGVVLGSGLTSFTDGVDVTDSWPYDDIPGFPRSTVSGHSGRVLLGRIGRRKTLIFAGRVHLYEGYEPFEVTFIVRLMAKLGVRTFIVTNASGGLDPAFGAGDLMLITDQLSLVSGPRRLPAMSFRMGHAYTARLQEHAVEAAREHGILLRRGVYAGALGPTYETPAEIQMLRRIGASAVGMSTVIEVQTAAALGLGVLGVALITNIPGGHGPTTHREVLEAGRLGGEALLALVSGVAGRL
ncbi:purine-nucleoside phosphorylase [bacterium]|nr:purine-nucleoside phosphorylase [bacterium]